MARHKGIDAATVADMTLEKQNGSEVSRELGVSYLTVYHHLRRQGVVQVKGKWIRVDDATIKKMFLDCGTVEDAANCLGVHPDYVQDAINRLALMQWLIGLRL